MKVFVIALLLVAGCFALEDTVEHVEKEIQAMDEQHDAPSEEYTEEENLDLDEGDMVLSPEQKMDLYNGKAYTSVSNLWNKNYAIPYQIESSLRGTRGETQIKAAIADYHRYTCLRFTPRTSTRQTTYLSFWKGRGCSSPVGYGRGKRSISLASGCWRKGTVIHEIGHSIGLYHEQSRLDRDRYIEILWNNITPRAKFNFNKGRTGTITSHGTPYDYSSVMHYPGKAFSANGGYTIRTRDSSKQRLIGQRTGFSRTDIDQIRRMYKC